MGSYEQLDEQAARALKCAKKAAGQMGRERIGTEYLLLGLLRQRRSMSGRILASAGVTERQLERKLTERYGRRNPRTSPTELTAHMQSVMEQAQKSSEGSVGTESLLGAILECRGCTARQMMEGMRADMVTLERLTGIKTLPEKKPRMMGARSGTSVLDKYAVDLTERARRGQLDPVIGRDDEVFRMLTILTRRTKNNPVLLGDPGVGKTALAEALAQAIADGNVPEELRHARILSIDMASLISGTKYRGEFEERLRNIVRELSANESIIAFVDEVHTLVGAGAAEGAIDASNLLKPALARGEIRLIGTTTVEEYHKTIEKDAALDRRFQRIDVCEPDEETALRILEGLAPRYATHHRVQLLPGVAREAVRISVRISPERFLPDKAIDLLDETCAAVHLQGRSEVLPADVGLTAQRTKGYREFSGGDGKRMLQMEEQLQKTVIGQKEAVTRISRAVRRGAAGLRDVSRPKAALLLTGPTGVGKTSVCEALAQFLFGRDSLIRIDLTEYQQPHDVSRLIGAPPGYKGYGEGGQLTEKIRRHPRSVVLFDEVEKAHPDVLRILLRLLEDGRLTDSEGKGADFRHAVIVLTSNLGAGISASRRVGFSRKDTREEQTEEEVRRVLSAELAARLDDIILFSDLQKEDCEAIAERELRILAQRCETQGVLLGWEPAVVRALGVVDHARGARAVRDEIARQIADPLAGLLLESGEADLVEILLEDGSIQLKRRLMERV
ncbi:MAG: ATP-dependent Clp protease ATP-binding subunit [Eubacteriales bacterium]|nr:ATP-dependent Clp protease ATP-binding subunit [Eubacteriales bacterium]